MRSPLPLATASRLSATQCSANMLFGDAVQATRDSAQAVFWSAPFRAGVSVAVVGGLAALGRTAWSAGKDFRKRSDGGDLTKDDLGLLIVCILIDAVGDTDLLFALPFAGWDYAWAPLSALLLRAILGSNALGGIELIKELLPGTDIIPVATIGWLLAYAYPGSASFLGISLPGDRTPPAP